MRRNSPFASSSVRQSSVPPFLAGQALAATADVVVEDVDVIDFVAVGPELVLDPLKCLGRVSVSSGTAQNGHRSHESASRVS